MTGARGTPDPLAAARAVADAVLYEGYVLYPYRASAAKNRLRWQFGVLVPPAADTGGEPDALRAECLLEPRSAREVSVELRFLRVWRRTVERRAADGTYTEVPELELPDRVLVPWEEGTEETVRIHLPARATTGDDDTTGTTRTAPTAPTAGTGEGVEDWDVAFDLPADRRSEPVEDAAGRAVGRLVRRAGRVTGTLSPALTELPGPYRVLRLTVTVRNTTPADRSGPDRAPALAHSLVGAHLLLAVPGGRFLSMTDPPEWARAEVAACRNDHTWPVLAGAGGGDDVVLSAPIILADHPALAEESPGPLYDATEIDEILSLRTAALTDREKREARGTDPRAAEVIDLVDAMPAAVRDRLHGAIRELRDVDGETEARSGPERAAGPGPAESGGRPDPSAAADGPVPRLALPDGPGHPWWDPARDGLGAGSGAGEGHGPGSGEPPDTVVVDGVTVGTGSAVVLTPGARRSDAQDVFLRGRRATVEAVVTDLDGETHLAVVLDDDPGTDLRRAQGRFLYFRPDEVVPESGGRPS
ncbi:hypothetical protein ACIQPQ_10565 [Streptomyces sp. NPDC091281]|uniref:hypothetical protein n=1 Tax=Streptomyces sp. NPDC091281 TaxID=3365985 RepID=UPI0037FB943A